MREVGGMLTVKRKYFIRLPSTSHHQPPIIGQLYADNFIAKEELIMEKVCYAIIGWGGIARTHAMVEAAI